jgi:hypothetical protein
MRLGMCSACMSALIWVPGPTEFSWPKYESRSWGRIASASGVVDGGDLVVLRLLPLPNASPTESFCFFNCSSSYSA